MIKSNHGECLIEGQGGDILIELNHIFHTMLTDEPELLIAATTAWSDVMETKIADLDETLLTALYKISRRLAKEYGKND